MPDRRPDNKDGTSTLLGELQAALWLTESLILALLEADVLNTDTILEAIDIVIAAKRTKMAEDHDPEIIRAAVTQLASISASIAAARSTQKRNGRTRQKSSS